MMAPAATSFLAQSGLEKSFVFIPLPSAGLEAEEGLASSALVTAARPLRMRTNLPREGDTAAVQGEEVARFPSKKFPRLTSKKDFGATVPRARAVNIQCSENSRVTFHAMSAIYPFMTVFL